MTSCTDKINNNSNFNPWLFDLIDSRIESVGYKKIASSTVLTDVKEVISRIALDYDLVIKGYCLCYVVNRHDQKNGDRKTWSDVSKYAFSDFMELYKNKYPPLIPTTDPEYVEDKLALTDICVLNLLVDTWDRLFHIYTEIDTSLLETENQQTKKQCIENENSI